MHEKSSKLINSAFIQNAYNELYSTMRKYQWTIDIVSDLADLEIECYKSISDVQKLSELFKTLKGDIYPVLVEDSDMKEAFDEFADLISDSESSTFVNITKENEVIR